MTEPRMKRTRASPAHAWAVGKTIQVDMPGAVKLTRKYGDQLVCVRYRVSPDGRERITTIELEIDRVPVQRKANPIVLVKIQQSDIGLIQKAQAKGARYDAVRHAWRLPRNAAHALGLSKRIVKPNR
jgi:hypothetical protein